MIETRLWIGFLFMLSVSLLTAQDINAPNTNADYSRFQQTLEEETNKLLHDSTTRQKILHPVEMPSWFFKIPPATDASIWVIGISDPGMEANEAIELAKIRALALASILNQSKVSSMTDNFTRENAEQENTDFVTRYVNFYQINSSLPMDSNSIAVENFYFNSFGEAVILIKYTFPIDSLYEISSQGNIYQVERQKQNTFENEEKTIFKGNISIKDSIGESFQYVLYSKNNLFEIKSSFNENILEFPYLSFRYVSDSCSGEINGIHNPVRLNYGLWKAFAEAFFKEYSILSQSHDVSLKHVGDAYTNKTQTLDREITSLNPAVGIRQIRVANNQLSIKLEFIN